MQLCLHLMIAAARKSITVMNRGRLRVSAEELRSTSRSYLTQRAGKLSLPDWIASIPGIRTKIKVPDLLFIKKNSIFTKPEGKVFEAV